MSKFRNYRVIVATYISDTDPIATSVVVCVCDGVFSGNCKQAERVCSHHCRTEEAKLELRNNNGWGQRRPCSVMSTMFSQTKLKCLNIRFIVSINGFRSHITRVLMILWHSCVRLVTFWEKTCVPLTSIAKTEILKSDTKVWHKSSWNVCSVPSWLDEYVLSMVWNKRKVFSYW